MNLELKEKAIDLIKNCQGFILIVSNKDDTEIIAGDEIFEETLSFLSEE